MALNLDYVGIIVATLTETNLTSHAADGVRGVDLCACSLRSHFRTQTATAYTATDGGVMPKIPY